MEFRYFVQSVFRIGLIELSASNNLPESDRRIMNLKVAISSFLTLVMLISMIPAVAFAYVRDSFHSAYAPVIAERLDSGAESYNAQSDGVQFVIADTMSVISNGATLGAFEDSHVNDDIAKDGNIDSAVGEDPAAVDISGWNGWSIAVDGDEAGALAAPAFNPVDYGEVLPHDEAAAVVLSGMLSREQSILVAVSDKIGARETIARDLVEAAYEEPASSEGAGDYLYWHVRSWASSVVSADGGSVYYVRFAMEYNSDAAQEAWVSAEAARVISSLGLDGLGAAEKAAAIHDWIVLNVAYDRVHESDSSYRAQFAAFGALHDRAAVCQGYATLYYRLCAEAGIACRVISGTGTTIEGSERHGWNIVEVDGAWYCVDCTWDAEFSNETTACRDYLLKSSDDFPGHTPDERFEADEFARSHSMAAISHEPVAASPFVTVAPVERVEAYGQKVEFQASAFGFSSGAELAYRWQFSDDGGQTWIDAATQGEDALSSTFAAVCEKAGESRLFRCRAESFDKRSAWSAPVSFRMWLHAEVLPASVVGFGDVGSFFAVARGDGAESAAYRWQCSDDGKRWSDCGSSYEGSSTAELSVPFDEPSRSKLFRCVLDIPGLGEGFTTSATGFKLEDLGVEVATYPVTAYGRKTTFSATTNADAVPSAISRYVWQWSRDGTSWDAVPASFSGAETASLEVPGAWVRKGTLYRCSVFAADGREAASGGMESELAAMEASAAASEVEAYGDISTFVASSTLDGVGVSALRYRWQRSVDGIAWIDCPASFPGCRSREMEVSFSADSALFEYRCLVSASDGRSATTEPVCMGLAELSATAVASLAAVGEMTTLSCSISGAAPDFAEYQWQVRDSISGIWEDLAGDSMRCSEAKLSISDASFYESAFRCVVCTEDGRTIATAPILVPKPDAPPLNVSLSTEPVDLGEVATLSCFVDGGGSDDLKMRIPAKDVDRIKNIKYEFSSDGGRSFEGCSNNSSEATEMRVVATEDGVSDLYRVVVTDYAGNETISQPIPIQVTGVVAKLSTSRVAVGETTAIECNLVGVGAERCSCQWQSSSDAVTWKNLNESSMTLSLVATVDTMKLQYRCVISHASKVVATSEPIALNVDTSVPEVTYRSYVRNVGWRPYVGNGAISGTTARSLPMDAVRIKLNDPQGKSAITYQAHVQDSGWQGWVKSNRGAGTTGTSKQMEAIRINLEGDYAKLFDVYYRVHVGDVGWLGWAKNGETAGSVGIGARIEAMQVQLVAKGSSFSTGGVHELSMPRLTYQAHISDKGWCSAVTAGKTAGITGRNKQMEALKVFLKDFDGASNGINVRAHVSDEGWQSAYASSGRTAGTTGKARAMECVVIQLAGQIDCFYDVYYRVYARGIGWLGWAKNNEWAGTTGGAKPIEAIQIKLLSKVDAPSFNRGGQSYRKLS